LGKLAIDVLARGDGWDVADARCSAGPHDPPFDERHRAARIAIVITGSFQYRSERGSAVMSPGSVLLGNHGQGFQCRHEHGTGDRCVAFEYSPAFFERAGAAGTFSVPRLPPMTLLAPWVVEARRATLNPGNVQLDELAHGLAGAVLKVLEPSRAASRPPSAADERRISAVVRFIEASPEEPLRLAQLAGIARMSEFHFLRVFREVTGVTPHRYVLRARLSEAALRLRTRDDSVLEIALGTGFGDLSNFNHAFRAEFGVNPARFRDGARRHR
jgi:AraC family transcriptional regulator